MLKKSFLLLIVFFVLQTFSACFFNCPEIYTYNVHYTGAEISAYNTSGFNSEPVAANDTVYKNAFGLTVGMTIELEKITYAALSSQGLAFSSAYAFSCEEDEYIYVDPIQNLRIFAAESDTSEVLDFTGRFGTFDYQGNLVSVEEMLANRAEWHDGFQLQLIDFDNIADNLMFKVEVTLESGNVYEAKTAVIHFYAD